jgi:cephalosporin hydroxylase
MRRRAVPKANSPAVRSTEGIPARRRAVPKANSPAVRSTEGIQARRRAVPKANSPAVRSTEGIPASHDEEVERNITALGRDKALHARSIDWVRDTAEHGYSYNFTWLGRPIIQYPQDMVAMQEIIWKVQPELVIETGIAHGGSLIFYAAMLELNAACGGAADASVVGIDIDIRPHNRAAIEAHPLFRRISMIEGSSIAPEVVDAVRQRASGMRRVLVCLDSNHTHDHVLAELEAYAPLASVGSYCVVFDTIVEDLPKSMFPQRPWGPGSNPRTAVRKYLQTHPDYEVDQRMDDKLLVSVAPGGYLRRTR